MVLELSAPTDTGASSALQKTTTSPKTGEDGTPILPVVLLITASCALGMADWKRKKMARG